MSKITRAEYMKNSSELFHKYYSQFVTESTKNFVKSAIGMDKIRASTDPHLNDIARHSPGPNGTWVWDRSPINLELARELGEVSQGYLPAPSTHTCVGKAAARMLLEEEQKG